MLTNETGNLQITYAHDTNTLAHAHRTAYNTKIHNDAHTKFYT